MAARPTFIDFRSQSYGPQSHSPPSLRPLTSPRLHIAGEVPPELSPLDAFAAQSRLLAKQLEKGATGDKRISRLPPLTIEDSFNLPRPSYFHSIPAENVSNDSLQSSPASATGLKTELEESGVRPVSIYPRLSSVPKATPDAESLRVQPQDEEQLRGRRPYGHITGFGTRREQSPGSIDRPSSPKMQDMSSYSSARPSTDSMSQRGQISWQSADNSFASGGYDSRSLAPPRSTFVQKTSSVRSASADGSDEDHSTSLGRSFPSESRKISPGSGQPNSPISSFIQSIPRSPSVNSDVSTSAGRLSRPAFNFSRPISRASETPLEMPSRQASSDSQPFVLADDTIHTPVSMHSDEFPENTNISPGAPSYVYSRFSLPRGKMLQRNSAIYQENMPPAEFHWEQPAISDSNVRTLASGQITTPPSPPSRPSTSSIGKVSSTFVAERSDTYPLDDQSRPRHDLDRFTDRRAYSMNAEETRPSTTPSTESASMIKPRSQHSITVPVEYSAEAHVTKGIECHELGSLNESTYHLRIAARQNHPTGMLLYALACRHGWGMRPNQQEGVQWLRKAADSAFLGVADDEGLMKDGRPVDILEQKTRKAQFALSIYELGVSHMNGWGIEQDKVLALRCFEIAGGLCSQLFISSTQLTL
jgi:hypothetical protein